MSVGKKVKTFRSEKSMTQDELAKKIKVTSKTIAKWEKEESEPNIEQLKLLSKTFNISIDELLENKVMNREKQKQERNRQSVFALIGIGLLTLLIIALIVLIVISHKVETSPIQEMSLNCSFYGTDYEITVASDGHYNCSNCNQSLRENIKKLFDYTNLDRTLEDISNYFETSGGICEE